TLGLLGGPRVLLDEPARAAELDPQLLGRARALHRPAPVALDPPHERCVPAAGGGLVAGTLVALAFDRGPRLLGLGQLGALALELRRRGFEARADLAELALEARPLLRALLLLGRRERGGVLELRTPRARGRERAGEPRAAGGAGARGGRR